MSSAINFTCIITLPFQFQVHMQSARIIGRVLRKALWYIYTGWNVMNMPGNNLFVDVKNGRP